MGALREKMVAEMKLRNFAARTQKSYLAVMVDLAEHYRQFPDQLTQEQIRTYLLHLQERGLSSSSLNGIQRQRAASRLLAAGSSDFFVSPAALEVPFATYSPAGMATRLVSGSNSTDEASFQTQRASSIRDPLGRLSVGRTLRPKHVAGSCSAWHDFQASA